MKRHHPRNRDKDKPLTATIFEHMTYTERRLKALGKLFDRFGMNLQDYIRRYRKKW